MIRISYGTAIKMGLKKGRMDAEPTTAYIMLGERCQSNCAFCAQRRDAPRSNYLSRIIWIPYPVDVLSKMRGFSRICFQTLDYPEVVDDLLRIIPILPSIPVSVSIVPISRDDMIRLKNAGVDTISIALDAANKEVFDEVKGKNVGNRFTWEGHWKALRIAIEVFENVNTHLIVGLGENDEDLINVMLKLREMNISVALFSYMPIFGGKMPDVGRYRAIQLSRYLMFKGYTDFFRIRDGKMISIEIPKEEMKNVYRGIPFLTSGCPGCNRPFYNERPGGMIYNYPYLPDENTVKKIMNELRNYAEITQIF